MKNIYEARDYVRYVEKYCKRDLQSKNVMQQYTDEHLVVPTFMMLLTTEAQEKYLAKNKFYQQALDEVFEKLMHFYLNTAKQRNVDVKVHVNRKYEMLHQALRCFQAIDSNNDLDDANIVNATKLLANMKMLHHRFVDIAIDYSQQDTVKMFKPDFSK